MKMIRLTEEQLRNLISESVKKVIKEEVDQETREKADRIVSRFSAMQALDLVEDILGHEAREKIYYALLDKYSSMWE